MFGERIEFIYRDGHLHRVILTGNARMEDTSPDSLAHVYAGLPEMDVLEGDSISVELENEQIRRTVVVGSASSRYTPLDLSEEVATNDVAGDTIVIHFRDERVARVDVRGNMSGTYRFARVEAMREMLGRSRRLVDLLARSERRLGGGRHGAGGPGRRGGARGDRFAGPLHRPGDARDRGHRPPGLRRFAADGGPGLPGRRRAWTPAARTWTSWPTPPRSATAAAT